MKLLRRKVLVSFIILYFCSGGITFAMPDAPSYAKWSQLAMKTAKEKYPKADIIDYLHIGREDKDKTSIEKFKLILVENGKKFSLYINIEFEPKNDKVIRITTKKSSA